MQRSGYDFSRKIQSHLEFGGRGGEIRASTSAGEKIDADRTAQSVEMIRQFPS